MQELYKQFNPAGKVFIVLNMPVADGCPDINVSPDKREVFLKDETEVINVLQAKLIEWFEIMQQIKVFEEPKQGSITFEKIALKLI